MRSPEFFCLRLQLDLVYLEFVDEFFLRLSTDNGRAGHGGTV